MSEETATRMGKSSERLSTPFARAPGFFLHPLLPSAFSWASRAGAPSPPSRVSLTRPVLSCPHFFQAPTYPYPKATLSVTFQKGQKVGGRWWLFEVRWAASSPSKRCLKSWAAPSTVEILYPNVDPERRYTEKYHSRVDR